MKNLGKDYDLTDANLLKIDSPRHSIEGPWSVVYKDLDARWVVVLLHWQGAPSLGIRWFWDKGGYPLSRGHATWMIVPEGMEDAILKMCPISIQKKAHAKDVLLGKIDMDELKAERNKILKK